MAPCRMDRQAHAPGVARRHLLAAAALSPAAHALTAPPGAAAPRLTADFEPQAAVWLGYDAGHETFTRDLATALQPHVRLKMLVRGDDDEARARAVLAGGEVDLSQVQFVHDPRALFFVRDAAVFGRDDLGRLAVVDFRWTHYGWRSWCRQRHPQDRAAAADCALRDHDTSDTTDRRLADTLGAAVYRSPLAMEGGGVEVNGQGLLIANRPLWISRNPELSPAQIEAALLRLPGIRKVLWLDAGLAQDPLHRATVTGRHVGWGTGGHTDEFVRFADARTVLLAWPDEAEAAVHPVAQINLRRMRRNLALLQQATDAAGRPLRVLKLPLPRVVQRRVFLSAAADGSLSHEWSADMFPPHEGRRQGDWVWQLAAASSLNFVVANGVVLVPDYRAHGTHGRQHDAMMAVLRQAFAGRELQLVDAIGANWVGGGAHCATLNEPA